MTGCDVVMHHFGNQIILLLESVVTYQQNKDDTAKMFHQLDVDLQTVFVCCWLHCTVWTFSNGMD